MYSSDNPLRAPGAWESLQFLVTQLAFTLNGVQDRSVIVPAGSTINGYMAQALAEVTWRSPSGGGTWTVDDSAAALRALAESLPANLATTLYITNLYVTRLDPPSSKNMKVGIRRIKNSGVITFNLNAEYNFKVEFDNDPTSTLPTDTVSAIFDSWIHRLEQVIDPPLLTPGTTLDIFHEGLHLGQVVTQVAAAAALANSTSTSTSNSTSGTAGEEDSEGLRTDLLIRAASFLRNYVRAKRSNRWVPFRGCILRGPYATGNDVAEVVLGPFGIPIPSTSTSTNTNTSVSMVNGGGGGIEAMVS